MIDARQRQLAQRMGTLALTLQDEKDRPRTLRAIVTAAVTMIPGTTCAGISLVRGKKVTSEAPSDPLVAKIDQVQTDLGEGPCVAAIREQRTVRVHDMRRHDRRWPHFAERAVGLGVHSSLSKRLFVRAEEFGALNLYAGAPEAFTSESEILADLVSQHAAVALAGATREDDLNAALANRDVIGQAKGILMHRDGLTGQQAFDLLVRASQDSNMKLADVAHWLVETTEQRRTD